MDILRQDRREAAEQRQELCEIITRLEGELQTTEENKDKVKEKKDIFSTRSLAFPASGYYRVIGCCKTNYINCLILHIIPNNNKV